MDNFEKRVFSVLGLLEVVIFGLLLIRRLLIKGVNKSRSEEESLYKKSISSNQAKVIKEVPLSR